MSIPPLQQLSTPIPTPGTGRVGNEDEWEYEYSNTETETYYVTLDLTNHATRTGFPMGRGVFKPKWLNPAKTKRKYGPAKMSLADKTQSNSTPHALDGDGEDDEDHEVDNEEVEVEGDEEAEHNAQGEQEPADESVMTVKEPAEVQILDLHTENPLVSYKGHVYSCKWEENIGTELLFTQHDPTSGLPILRTLPNDLDLLASSAIRITSSATILEPVRTSRSQLGDFLRMPAMTDDGETLRIPVGSSATLERKEQARFLERLMAVKQRKGEEDEVTVIAQKRFTNTGWRAQFNDKRKEEKAELMEIAKGTGPEAENASYRLQEMEEEDEERAQEQRLRSEGLVAPRKPGRRPKNPLAGSETDDVRAIKRPRGPIQRRPRGGKALMNEQIRQRQREMTEGATVLGAQESGDSSTPQAWDNLQDK